MSAYQLHKAHHQCMTIRAQSACVCLCLLACIAWRALPLNHALLCLSSTAIPTYQVPLSALNTDRFYLMSHAHSALSCSSMQMQRLIALQGPPPPPQYVVHMTLATRFADLCPCMHHLHKGAT